MSRIKKRKAQIVKWFKEYTKDSYCKRCGEDARVCLVFHHVKKKRKGISIMVYGGYSKESIIAELAKCICLCANCHRKAHEKDDKRNRKKK